MCAMAARRAFLAALLALLAGQCAAEAAPGRPSGPEELAECADEAELGRVQLLQQELLVSRGLSPEKATKIAAPTTTSTTLPPDGMTLNAAGDLTVLITSMCMYYGATIFFVSFFSIMRLRYPVLYSNNAIEGIFPVKPPRTFFGWFKPTMRLTVDQIAKHITLDHAMLIEFSHLGMKITSFMGIPMIVIGGTLNCAFGGFAAGDDHLSYLSFGNVEFGSWLYWVHSFDVWLVVLYVTWVVHDAMRKFMPRRVKWLEEIADIQANTVLVEGIPEECRTEQKVRDTFDEILPGAKLSKVEFLKDTSALDKLVSMHTNALYYLQVAEAEAAKHPDTKPMVREGFMGTKVEAVPYWKKQSEELEPQVQRERQRVKAESDSVAGVNLSSVFVTFVDRTSAELALRTSGSITFDENEWVVLQAPEPCDILWADLTQDDTARHAREVIGYLLVGLLYFAYMPIVLLVTNLAKIVELKWFGLGMFQSVWDGVAPTLGLQFIVAMLPTFLILLFQFFFTLRTEVAQQQKLQVWYFWFQFVFVLLATAIGQNFMLFAGTLVSDPMNIVPVLADTMPYATHYFMNFLVMQCFSHGMNCTRYIQWMKFKAASVLFDEKEAKRVAEPEDQDYYGMGSRSARWTIMLGVCLVFGTMSPPMHLFCFITFLVCRIIYGYLVVFAETKKSDSGGCFYVKSLEQIFPLLVLYIIVMAGVFYKRSSSSGPCVIAATSLIWVFASLNKFKHYSWETLPMQEMHASKEATKKQIEGQYVQPSLLN
mmetsp:Transcript_56480/g.136447  ORF Transcript_56480/g.136447 Transcript_56480/m.136447 type:complete len:765 (+) Transcript_56480:50-2344(+)